MALNLVYERVNQEMFDILSSPDIMQAGSDISSIISNDIFPTFLNKVGDVITRGDITNRMYNFFKMPLSEFGALTEYIATSMVKPDNAITGTTGQRVDDFVVNNPNLIATYATKLVRANYPLTIQSEKFLEMVDNRNMQGIAMLTAVSLQALYDGVEHDHDIMIPALMGALLSLLSSNPRTQTRCFRQLPAFTGNDIEGYAKQIVAIFKRAIRDMSQFRNPDYNVMGADMADSLSDLCLVSFDNPLNNDFTAMDVLESQFEVAPTARASGLSQVTGTEVQQMPSLGVITTSVARAYGIPNFPGMQTADTTVGNVTRPYPNVHFALLGRGALNVGLKRLQVDSGRSIRGHFDQTWVLKTLQLAYGAGQAIFFHTGPVPTAQGLAFNTTTGILNENTGKTVKVTE